MAVKRQMQEDKAWLSQWWEVSWNPAVNGLVVHQFELPDGWQPQTVDLLLRYISRGPIHHAWTYLPADTEHPQGETPHFTDRMVSDGARNWRWYCVHRLIEEDQEVDIEDVLRLLMASLNHPEDDLPVVTDDGDTPSRDINARDLIPF